MVVEDPNYLEEDGADYRPNPYYVEEEDTVDFASFLKDTIDSEDTEIVTAALELIYTETKHLKIGSTSDESIIEDKKYLDKYNANPNEDSFAYGKTIVRVLKDLKGIYYMNPHERVRNLDYLASRYILKREDRGLRDVLDNGKTLDQHQREHGAGHNIQRHVLPEEMALSLVYVRDLFLQYVQRVKQSQQD